jgi:hypothetical protein
MLASRRDEMEDNGGHDACPNGNDCARPLVRENAKGEQREDGQYGDFGKDFHEMNMRPEFGPFPARNPATFKLTHYRA